MNFAVRGLTSRPAPGSRVRLTGYFLAATGQRASDDGAKRWTVPPCECDLCCTGLFAAVDEALDTSVGYEDIEPAKRPQWRHVALAHLERVGEPPKAADLPDALAPLAPVKGRGRARGKRGGR